MTNQAINTKRAEIAFKTLFYVESYFIMAQFLYFTIFLALCCNYCG